MFQIGEFSKLTQVSIRMLRYYDEAGLLPPAFVDPITGYRMYTTSQIDALQKIVFLRDLGFHIASIKDALKHWEEEGYLAAILQQQKEQISVNIRKEQEMLLRIESAIKDSKGQHLSTNLQVAIRKIPSQRVLSIRKFVDNYYCEEELWKEMMTRMTALQLHHLFSQPSYSIYHGFENENGNGIDMETCVVVPEQYQQTWEDEKLSCHNTRELTNAACFFVYGGFEQIAKTYEQFANWLEQHPNYQMCGESRQIVHKGPPMEMDPKNFIIELQVEIKIRMEGSTK